MTAVEMQLATSPITKVRRRNRARGMSGSAARASQATKAAKVAAHNSVNARMKSDRSQPSC
ncbi:MAG TPA: hypothetical protein VMX54_09635 [Vicinamibacteria bacterium]|nr:hypothetical protein [Vicinamibacteria bacterium]